MNNLAIRRLLLGIAVLLFSIALTPLNDTMTLTTRKQKKPAGRKRKMQPAGFCMGY